MNTCNNLPATINPSPACPILACPNSRPRSLAAAWQAFIMRRDTCDRGTSAVLMLPESSFLRAVRTCIAPSAEHTACDTGEGAERCECGRMMDSANYHAGRMYPSCGH